VTTLFSINHTYCIIDAYHIQDQPYGSPMNDLRSSDIFLDPTTSQITLNTAKPFVHTFWLTAYRNQGLSGVYRYIPMEVEVCGYEKISMINNTFESFLLNRNETNSEAILKHLTKDFFTVNSTFCKISYNLKPYKKDSKVIKDGIMWIDKATDQLKLNIFEGIRPDDYEITAYSQGKSF
jgi:hypothetical protein